MKKSGGISMRSVSIALALTFIITASSLNLSFAQEDQSAQYQYSESAIRRFEIITLVSLPFTSIHSYLIVRLVEMARQGEVSPDLSNGDWHAIQACAVGMALLVGVWDWLHTRSIDRNEPRIPNLKPPKEKGSEGTELSAIRIKF